MEQILGLQTKEYLMRGLIALTLVLLSIHGLLTSKICERLMAGSWLAFDNPIAAYAALILRIVAPGLLGFSQGNH
jgi:hypothetical protein